MDKLDGLDFMILDLYLKDGKFTYSQIARILNVSEGTVRQRTKKMRDDGVFDFIIKIDPKKIGLSIKAIIGVTVNFKNQEQFGLWLSSFSHVVSVDSVSGYHDFIIQAYFNSNDELVHFINNELGKAEELIKMNVSIRLKEYKNSFNCAISNKNGKSII